MQRCFSLTADEETKIQAYADGAKISFSRAVRLLSLVGLATMKPVLLAAGKEAGRR